MSDWETPAEATEPTEQQFGTEEVAAEEPAAETKPQLTKDEFNEKARAAGWTEATAFNYDEFQRLGGNDADWHGAAKSYEWKDEYGDVGPEVPELEKILFGGEFQMRKGEHYHNLASIEVGLQGPVQIAPVRRVSQQHTPMIETRQLTDVVRGRGPAPRHHGEYQEVPVRTPHSNSGLHHSRHPDWERHGGCRPDW